MKAHIVVVGQDEHFVTQFYINGPVPEYYAREVALLDAADGARIPGVGWRINTKDRHLSITPLDVKYIYYMRAGESAAWYHV